MWNTIFDGWVMVGTGKCGGDRLGWIIWGPLFILAFKTILYYGKQYIMNSLNDINHLFSDWVVENLGRYATIVFYFSVGVKSNIINPSVSNVLKFLIPKTTPYLKARFVKYYRPTIICAFPRRNQQLHHLKYRVVWWMLMRVEVWMEVKSSITILSIWWMEIKIE